MTAPTRSRDRLASRGFTLVEALVSILLLAIVLAAILSNLTTGMQGIRQNGVELLVRTAASQKMEALRAETFTQLAADPTMSAFTDGFGNIPDADGMVYIDKNFNGQLDLLRITVTVSQRDRTYRLVSLVSQ